MVFFRCASFGANRLSIGCACAMEFWQSCVARTRSARRCCSTYRQLAAMALLMRSATSASKRPSMRARSGLLVQTGGDRARLQQFHEIKPGGGAGIGTLKGGKVPHARWHGGQAGVGVCQVTLAACLWQRGAARLQGSPISRAGRKVQNPGRGFAAGSAMQPKFCSRVVLLTAVHLALPAGDVPNLNIMPGCQAAANGSVGKTAT
jgi:hypothetical protein